MTKGDSYETTSANVKELDYGEAFMRLKERYPDVFADDGIPFAVQTTMLPQESSYGWTLSVPYAISLLTLPVCKTSEWNWRYAVDVVDAPDAHAKFSRCYRHDSAFALLTPSPLLFYLGSLGSLGNDGRYGESRRFSSHCLKFWNESIFGKCTNGVFIDDAYAYGVAVTLKKMADAGLLDASRYRKGAGAVLARSPMENNISLDDFKREDGCDYRYLFTARCRGTALSLHDLREVQKTLRKMIREDYAASFPAADRTSLVVDFEDFTTVGAEVSGKAAVLLLQVKSLNYDPHTRKGVMGIEIAANQYADARKYVRKNIEAVVRDKNIALEAGGAPPPGAYRLLDEKLRGNLLEITFMAE